MPPSGMVTEPAGVASTEPMPHRSSSTVTDSAYHSAQRCPRASARKASARAHRPSPSTVSVPSARSGVVCGSMTSSPMPVRTTTTASVNRSQPTDAGRASRGATSGSRIPAVLAHSREWYARRKSRPSCSTPPSSRTARSTEAGSSMPASRYACTRSMRCPYSSSAMSSRSSGGTAETSRIDAMCACSRAADSGAIGPGPPGPLTGPALHRPRPRTGATPCGHRPTLARRRW